MQTYVSSVRAYKPIMITGIIEIMMKITPYFLYITLTYNPSSNRNDRFLTIYKQKNKSVFLKYFSRMKIKTPKNFEGSC